MVLFKKLRSRGGFTDNFPNFVRDKSFIKPKTL